MQQNKQTNYMTGETKRRQITDLINGESGSNDDVLSKIESYVHKKVRIFDKYVWKASHNMGNINFKIYWTFDLKLV